MLLVFFAIIVAGEVSAFTALHGQPTELTEDLAASALGPLGGIIAGAFLREPLEVLANQAADRWPWYAGHREAANAAIAVLVVVILLLVAYIA